MLQNYLAQARQQNNSEKCQVIMMLYTDMSMIGSYPIVLPVCSQVVCLGKCGLVCDFF